jgi:hypothetical protein
MADSIRLYGEAAGEVVFYARRECWACLVSLGVVSKPLRTNRTLARAG